MTIDVRPYRPDDDAAWDAFCGKALQATFLHTRNFLSYHGDRFLDRSMIAEEDGNWLGIFPAAQHPSDASCVVSHPGITYGGVVHQGGLRGDRMVHTLDQIRRCYADQGYAKLVYKAVPGFYHQSPAQDDLYALFRMGAKRIRCDLSCTIDLHNRLPVSKRRHRSLKKAINAGVEIVEGAQYLAALWEVLAENLARKHDAQPVHTFAEINLLAERFPDNIRCICGRLDGRIVAGTVLFVAPGVFHAQYIAANELGYEVSALDRVFEYCIEGAEQENKRWFDFGISNEEQGMLLNDGLYRFKSEFGGGGTVHEFYEVNLLKGE